VAEYAEIPVEGGPPLLVQAPPSLENELVEAGRATDVAAGAVRSLGDALAGIRSAADSAIDTLRSAKHAPQEITVSFSVQLAAEAGVVIASTAASANMSVSMTWKEA